MTPLERLIEAVNATAFSVRRIEDYFNQFNDPAWPALLAHPLNLTKEYLAINCLMPTPSVAEDYVDLAGILGEITWPPVGGDPDADARIFDLQDRVNRLVFDCFTIVSVAKEMGIGYAQPTSLHPDGLQVPRTGNAATIAAIAGHVDDLEFQLTQLADTQDNESASLRQRAIVATYRQVVSGNIRKIRTALQTGTTLALDVLDRTSAALVSATRQLVATIRASASRATPALRTAANAMRKPVQGVVRSFGALVKRLMGQTDSASLLDIPDDFALQAKAMILASSPPPTEWVPFLSELNFQGSSITNLRLIKNLSNLQTLDLMNTQIFDLSPLANLTSLKILYLTGTKVRDISPLGELATLQDLYLRNTDVVDLSPISELTGLRFLDLRDTAVISLYPLSKHLNLVAFVEDTIRATALRMTLDVGSKVTVRVLRS